MHERIPASKLAGCARKTRCRFFRDVSHSSISILNYANCEISLFVNESKFFASKRKRLCFYTKLISPRIFIAEAFYHPRFDVIFITLTIFAVSEKLLHQ